MQMTLSVVRHSRRMKQTIFITILGLNLAGYLLFRYWFPLAPFHQQLPLSDIRSFLPTLTKGAAYGFLFLGLYGLYLLAYYLVRRLRVHPQLWLIVGATILFSLPLLQTYPVNSSDVFRYYLRGRITSVYGENVYETPPSAFPDDPYMAYSGEWIDETSPYGPVWELVMAGITAVTPYHLYIGLVAVKGLALLAFVGSGLLIWHMLVHVAPDKRIGYTLLWLWNPALLSIFVMNAHNDALMIFWLLVGALLLKRGKLSLGFLMMVIAVLTKPVALLVLPIFFLACMRAFPTWQARIRFGTATAVGSFLLVMLTFAPFGSPFDLAVRLLRESANYPGFSPWTVAFLQMSEQGVSLRQAHLEQAAAVGRLFLLGIMVWVLWRTWHGRSPIRGAADILFGYLVQALAFRIWYVVWPFPWLLLDDTDEKGDGRLPYRLRFGLCFLLTSQLSVIIYGHLHAYHFSFENYPTHLIGVPFTFGLPFLLAALPDLQRRFYKS